MSKASNLIYGLKETKVADIHKALSDLDPSSWNTFMSEIQSAIQDTAGVTVPTIKLDKSFKRLIGKR